MVPNHGSVTRSWGSPQKRPTDLGVPTCYKTSISPYIYIYIFMLYSNKYRYIVSWWWNNKNTKKDLSVQLEGFVRVEWNRARWHKKGMEGERTNDIWLVVSNIFYFPYGMSSFPLTNSYFSRWLVNHQTDMMMVGIVFHSCSTVPGRMIPNPHWRIAFW